MQELNDQALLRHYADHASEEAFATLVARHVNKVYSVALRHTRNPSQAEEITQAVFVILAKKSARLGRGVVLSGWLYHAARLTALTAIRGAIRRAHREQEAHMQISLDTTESEAWSEIAPLLDAAMSDLSEADRHALVLRFFDGRSLKEVGTALGASEDTAKMRLTRAVEKLRRYFARHGIAHSSEVLTATISTHGVQAAPLALVKAVTAVALAQGALASASTSTLIQGALKVMAWTKLKTATVATAAALLAVGATTVAIVHLARGQPDIQGAWEGMMRMENPGIQAGQLAGTRMVLKLAKTPGGYNATVDWIDLPRSLPNGHVKYKYPEIELDWGHGQLWKLRVNETATAMVWDHTIHFIQPDPVELKRTAAPDKIPAPLTESEFARRAGSDLQGYWEGAIGAGPDALPVRLKIAENPDGTYRAEADNPMQGMDGQPVTVTYTKPTVTITLTSGIGIFQGQVDSAATEMAGTLTQHGQSTPTVFKRGDFQAEQLKEAGKDYSFQTDNDLQGHWAGAWLFMKVPVREVLDIAKMPDGTYSAAVLSPDDVSGISPIPASDIYVTGPEVRLTCKWAGLGFEGKLNKGKLTGSWKQGGSGFPLELTRQP